MLQVQMAAKGIVADHGVEGNDKLSHDGDDGHFGLLAGVEQASFEGLESGIEHGGGLGSHEENASDGGSAAKDVAQAFHLAAVEVVRNDANQGGDRPIGQSAEFGQEGEQSGGQDWTDARHGTQQIAAGAERGVCGNGLGNKPVELGDVALELSDTAGPAGAAMRRRAGVGLGCRSAGWHRPVGDAPGPARQADRRFDRDAPSRLGSVATNLAMTRASNRSFLASTPAALANRRSFQGLTERDRQARLKQADDSAALISAAGFDADGTCTQRLEPPDQRPPAGVVVGHAELFIRWMHGDIQVDLSRHQCLRSLPSVPSSSPSLWCGVDPRNCSGLRRRGWVPGSPTACSLGVQTGSPAGPEDRVRADPLATALCTESKTQGVSVLR